MHHSVIVLKCSELLLLLNQKRNISPKSSITLSFLSTIRFTLTQRVGGVRSAITRNKYPLMNQSNTEQSISFSIKQVIQVQERLQKLRSSECEQTVLKQSSPLQSINYNEIRHNSDSICAYVTMKDEKINRTKQDTQNEHHQVPMNVISSPTYTFENNELGTIFQQQMSKDMPVVNVISRAHLPDGYTFEAAIGHTRLLSLIVSIL